MPSLRLLVYQYAVVCCAVLLIILLQLFCYSGEEGSGTINCTSHRFLPPRKLLYRPSDVLSSTTFPRREIEMPCCCCGWFQLFFCFLFSLLEKVQVQRVSHDFTICASPSPVRGLGIQWDDSFLPFIFKRSFRQKTLENLSLNICLLCYFPPSQTIQKFIFFIFVYFLHL